MPTDPARVKLHDKGNPEKCPVWQFHLVYSDEKRRAWVTEGCTSASIGCIECKKTVSEAILLEQQPMLERAKPYIDHPKRVREIVDAGCKKAQSVAEQTMFDVRKAMGLNY
jgi:tryptophanyl-tRNA synthetase